jgi:hypothetical protein
VVRWGRHHAAGRLELPRPPAPARLQSRSQSHLDRHRLHIHTQGTSKGLGRGEPKCRRQNDGCNLARGMHKWTLRSLCGLEEGGGRECGDKMP